MVLRGVSRTLGPIEILLVLPVPVPSPRIIYFVRVFTIKQSGEVIITMMELWLMRTTFINCWIQPSMKLTPSHTGYSIWVVEHPATLMCSSLTSLSNLTEGDGWHTGFSILFFPVSLREFMVLFSIDQIMDESWTRSWAQKKVVVIRSSILLHSWCFGKKHLIKTLIDTFEASIL